jgi:hypothetical protein
MDEWCDDMRDSDDETPKPIDDPNDDDFGF